MRFDGPALARDLQGWLDRPESNFGWFVHLIPEDSFSIISFASREDAENAPELTLFTGNPDAPRAFFNGEYVDDSQADVDTLSYHNLMWLESPYPNGHIFFTLDGSKPTLISTRYEQTFRVHAGDVLRAVTYSSDYSLGGVELNVTFHALPTYSFNVSQVGSGNVITSPTSNTSPARYSSNTVLHLVAVPIVGWEFTGWTGDFESTESNLVLPITRDISLQANFAPEGFPLSTRRIQDDFVLIQFDALLQYIYQLQSSSDLQTWTTVQTFADKAGLVDAIFPLEYSTKGVFYRIVSTLKGSTASY